MTRIEPLQNPSGKAAELLTMVEKKLGRRPNMMKTLAHAPAALEMYLTMSGVLNGSSLNLKDRERIALLSAKENECAYCERAHSALGKMAGLSDAEVADAKGAAGPGTSDAILKFSRAILTKNGKIDDTDVAQARTAGLNDGQLLEIVAVTTLNIFTNYVNHLAEPEIDF